ncbi:MAG: DUF5317 family protein [Acidimicrobiales bacterium]
MAALLTVLAIGAGLALGLRNGGNLGRVLHYRPELWQAGAGGLLVQLVIRVSGVSGGWAVVLEILSALALLAFTIANIRLGGMVVIALGLFLNLVPTVVDWGVPTSRDALVSAGVIEKNTTGRIELAGARHVATNDDSLTWLGETIALPTGQVISFGDVLLQVGYLLVTASLVRGRFVRRDRDGDYRRRIAPLGQGPARRRGPGLHPSRMTQLAGARRRTRADEAPEPDDEWDADEVWDDGE